MRACPSAFLRLSISALKGAWVPGVCPWLIVSAGLSQQEGHIRGVHLSTGGRASPNFFQQGSEAFSSDLAARETDQPGAITDHPLHDGPPPSRTRNGEQEDPLSHGIDRPSEPPGRIDRKRPEDGFGFVPGGFLDRDSSALQFVKGALDALPDGFIL
jgi:hypothetical protein